MFIEKYCQSKKAYYLPPFPGNASSQKAVQIWV